MATLAPSSASARALAAPMPREPPVTRATLPVSDLAIGFLRCLKCRWPLDMRFRMVHKQKLSKHIVSKIVTMEKAVGKASRFRGPRDFRKSRGIAVFCSGFGRTGAVQGHGVPGRQPAGGAARRPAVQPHLAAARLDGCRAKAVGPRGASVARWRGGGERG